MLFRFGKNLEVPKGWTVMQAAKKMGVSIPHFCWHPGLSVAGVCRFCLVHVEGARKLEIACNLQVREGMVVRTDIEEVKEAHKWALEFHLINHPLDCPICDQAGECGLQDYYMEVGLYKSQMNKEKVLKPKAIDAGSELILDTERCILCSRCVRFENEVTKTNALGIFDRGDRAILRTFKEEKITHNYQENLVDICPVGAFTSKKFRFKQRVWFLKEFSSICPGCETGCHINIHGRPERNRYFRVKPRIEEGSEQYWMCDKGRDVIQHLNPENRMTESRHTDSQGRLVHTDTASGIEFLANKLDDTAPDKIGILVTAQYTSEEYEAFFRFFIKKLGIKNIHLWRDEKESLDEFDGILLRGDRNPNTRGLMTLLKKYDIEKSIVDEFSTCISQDYDCLIVLGPEIYPDFQQLKDRWKQLEGLPFVSYWGVHFEVCKMEGIQHLLPLKGFAEKRGTFVNFKGESQRLEQAFPAVVSDALDIQEVISKLDRPSVPVVQPVSENVTLGLQ